MLLLKGDQSEIIISSNVDGSERRFPCSVPALLGAQRGTRTHLVSKDGECILSKEADGIWLTVQSPTEDTYRYFISPAEYLAAIGELVENKVIQRRISLK
jgi:hypothetical protein